ncbi:hypothetical protein LTR95_006476 [Oleoguttula sp. CCFEE 5521]
MDKHLDQQLVELMGRLQVVVEPPEVLDELVGRVGKIQAAVCREREAGSMTPGRPKRTAEFAVTNPTASAKKVKIEETANPSTPALIPAGEPQHPAPAIQRPQEGPVRLSPAVSPPAQEQAPPAPLHTPTTVPATSPVQQQARPNPPRTPASTSDDLPPKPRMPQCNHCTANGLNCDHKAHCKWCKGIRCIYIECPVAQCPDVTCQLMDPDQWIGRHRRKEGEVRWLVEGVNVSRKKFNYDEEKWSDETWAELRPEGWN